MVAKRPSIGVLGLQGDFFEHLQAFETLGVEAHDVRSAQEIDDSSALVIPGGESTTILKLLARFDLKDLLRKEIENGTPVFGTCAGGIIMSNVSSDGEEPLSLMDLSVRRNAYGRQVDSFEADIEVRDLGVVSGTFIRAPIIESVGPDVEVLAEWAGHPVLVRERNMLVSTFHPELTGDTRVHRYFVEKLIGWSL